MTQQAEEPQLWLLRPAPLVVDWETQEDEWHQHLVTALGGLVTMSGYGSRLYRPPEVSTVYHELTVNSTPPLAPLRLYWTPEGVVAGLISPPATAEDKRKWQEAVDRATEELGEKLRSFAWVAYIAGDRIVLSEGTKIGTLQLGRTSKPYREAATSSYHPTFGGFSLDWSYPVRVESATSGVTWNRATFGAGEDLYRLCAVLSVLLDSHWVVKQSPHPLELGDIEVPARSGLLPDKLGPEDGQLDRRDVELPAELDEAWLSAGEPEIAGALSAYYRGLRLEEDDPPTALALFVAAIEGVGALDVPLTKCECCENCPVRTGSRRRFRAALKRVMSSAESKPLRDLYDLRSGVAHGSLITGQTLSTSRITRVGWFYVSEEHQLLGKTWDIRQASRRILISALCAGSVKRPSGSSVLPEPPRIPGEDK